MFKKVLIANRGEVALRIIRTCKELGIETVTIHSEEDKEQLHVKLSDYSYCIGKANASNSYLNIPSIITIALKTNCDAIHPGYGFLAENFEFVKVLEDLGIKFIGPSSKTIKLMGDKIEARKLMKKNNIPVIPGSFNNITSLDEAIKICKQIGYPVLIKSTFGGGGRGMRKVFSEEELKTAFYSAKQEAMSAFGNDNLYIEKLILNPKHIEFQILRDSFGNTVHLFERHCSIQRKNQKMIEEAPYKNLDNELRKKMGDTAVKIANICNYENAGTVEFILDGNNFYFMEMNTRLQVEHPITEMITNIDIVKEQIKISNGIKLNLKQEDIKIEGHSIEVRINSENPLNNFSPSTGYVDFLFCLQGFNVRFDTYLFNGAKISPFYDSMIGKIIVKGSNRLEAIRKMRTTIENTIISGIDTNLSYQYGILHTNDFIRGDYNTNFIEKHHEEILNWINKIEEINE